MSLGYSTGALHSRGCVNPAAYLKSVEPAPLGSLAATSGLANVTTCRVVPSVPPVLYIPVDEIIAWRDQFNRDHMHSLGQPVTWNEHSDFHQSEDYSNHGDTLLRYAAGVWALGASEDALRIPSDDYASLKDLFGKVYDAPPTRFTQLLRCQDFWLPFQPDIVIETKDWRGHQQSFGSSLRLLRELQEIEPMLAKLDPNLRTIPAETRFPYRRTPHSPRIRVDDVPGHVGILHRRRRAQRAVLDRRPMTAIR